MIRIPPRQVTVRPLLPAGWSQKPDARLYAVAAQDVYPIQLTVKSAESHKGTWQTLTWNAESDGQKIGTVTLRVDVVSNGLPQ